MRRIYLDAQEKRRFKRPRTITVDKVPPKSMYYDRNRSDIVVSPTFKYPSKEVVDELYLSSKRHFQKPDKEKQ